MKEICVKAGWLNPNGIDFDKREEKYFDNEYDATVWIEKTKNASSDRFILISYTVSDITEFYINDYTKWVEVKDDFDFVEGLIEERKRMDNKLGVLISYGYSNGYDYDDVTGVWFNDIEEAEIWINKRREENACFRVISYVEATYKEYREWVDTEEKYLQLKKKFNDTSKVPMEWR